MHPNNPLDLAPGDIIHPTGDGWYGNMTAEGATGTVVALRPDGTAVFVMDDDDSRTEWLAFEAGDDRWSVERAEPAHDPVNHPSHYKRGGLEAIDVMEAFNLHRDGRLFNGGKYILRAGEKDLESQDIRKAIWYLSRYADDLEARGL